ncbi:hypothetical protein AAGF08_08280 [Algoriphagus sp. SE2]|uniref:hypothetical protein n=1 Tax=Algoriphagus sp. SE2 TaxID=3141536 RepID=UPI0031CD372B
MTNPKKLKRIIFGFFALSFMILTSCELEPSEKIDPIAPELLYTERNESQTIQDFSKLGELLIRTNSRLKNGSESARMKGLGANSGPNYLEIVERVLQVVNPSPCGPTDYTEWLEEENSDWSSVSRNFAELTLMYVLPTYNALLFENNTRDQYFGKDGEFTQSVNKTFKDLKRFWDIPSNDIVLTAMHGNILLEREKLIRTYTDFFGLSPESAENLADAISFLLETFPEYRNGDHPNFTLNALALEGLNFMGEDLPNKIILGDGFLEGFAALGFNDIAPKAILAHEFAHQIQFKLNIVDSPTTDLAEASRRVELMADAYAAYYLSHARGASMQWKRVQQFLEVFFLLGDCEFGDPGHHGTPLQRMAAAKWGNQLAEKARKQGHIMSSKKFADLFEAQLPIIVSP